MTSIDLKTKLIEIINEIDDVEFLEAIKTILDTRSGNQYTLSDKQKEGIEEGRQQIKEGNFLKNSDVFSELNEWIKKK
jgi:predicted transcriptional regulator